MSGFSFPPVKRRPRSGRGQAALEEKWRNCHSIYSSVSVSLKAVPPFVAQTRKLFFGRPYTLSRRRNLAEYAAIPLRSIAL